MMMKALTQTQRRRSKMTGAIFHNRYEILEVLGNGSTAIVYKARDLVLNRLVTIKILREQYASDDAFVRRFKREAQAVACLSHPNIVSIYDVVFEGDSHYLVMEYVEGRSLKEYIESQGGRLELSESLWIMDQLLCALQHAHEHNVIHRDIKPHNILLTDDLEVKVTDFGIAVAVSDITQNYSKDIMGSVHYMSPEQVKGTPVTEASDIYSAGIVMYELITGLQPFKGENAVGVAMQHIQGSVAAPHKLMPELPLELSFIVMKAIRREMSLRYSSAQEMLKALRAAALGEDAEEAFAEDETVVPAAAVEEKAVEQEEDVIIRKPAAKETAEKPAFERKARPERPERRTTPKTARPAKTHSGGGNKKPLIIGIAVAAVVVIVLAVVLLSGLFGDSPDRVKVENMVGMDLAEAAAVLEGQGLLYEVIEFETDDEDDINKVLQQSEAVNAELLVGSTVKLTVGIGQVPVEVPSVLGLSKRDAILKLQALGFFVKDETETNTDVEPGEVFKQSPEEGETLAEGGTITITVSSGKEVGVPKLVGMTYSQAVQSLKENGLNVGNTSRAESTEYKADYIVAQGIEAGTTVSEGETIDLVISLGPGPSGSIAKVNYTLPDVQGIHIIKIIVVDTEGSREVYIGSHQGNETVTQDVTFYGTGTIQVKMDDEIVYSENVSQ